MTVADPTVPPVEASRGDGSRRTALSVRDICPYLRADEGWRSTTASRDHRCQAVRPAGRLALDQQRRLCLDASHEGCPAYLAALASPPTPTADDLGDVQVIPAGGSRMWHFTRTSPALIDDGRLGLPIPIGGRERSVSQAGLGAVLVGVLLLLVVIRFTGGGGSETELSTLPSAGASTSPAATLAATVRPSVVPSPTPLATPADRPSASPTGAVAGATASAPPSATRRYRVRSGDTLVGIAGVFGTTVKALQELNGIEDPTRLRVGQILLIP